MRKKLFTKSAFKQSLSCQTGLYYLSQGEVYANQDTDDDFLKSLAEGGFQVGEIAKVYFSIPEEQCIESLDYEESLAQTAEFFKNDRINIAEAAFRWGNCFVRTDIIVKDRNRIDLIEVKAKSWDPRVDSFTAKRDSNTISGDIREYVYDVAFQKYVVVNALKELYPDTEYKVTAYLMMADKSKVADVDGINQMFVITECEDGRTRAIRTREADDLVNHEHVVTPFLVDELCDSIIDGKTSEQADMFGCSFQEYVDTVSKAYVYRKRLDAKLGAKCFQCPFYLSAGDMSGLKDGYRECWCHQGGLSDSDFNRPMVKDLWGAHIRREKMIEQGKYFLDEIEQEDIKPAQNSKPGLSHSDRKWLQIGLWTENNEILKDFADELDGDTYLAKDELKQRMDSWTYPLHMIDFETTAVALPFYKGMSPYEQVAFQFSHHIIRKDDNGNYTIEHAGQFLNTKKGYFPNFDFVRELKRQLEQDNGTIFRYSGHENTILRKIHEQLSKSQVENRQELMDWIDTITNWKDGSVRHQGARDMEDLLEIVKSFYYHKSMKGSNSIKAVLPAVLNSSRFIQEKYSKAIYGSEIKSRTFSSDEPIAWISYAQDGVTVENPYKHLPPVGSYIDVDDSRIDYESESYNDDMTVANGGAALTAYSKLQFSDTVASDALSKALLRYCELDTMAMVFIWEFFYHEIYMK